MAGWEYERVKTKERIMDKEKVFIEMRAIIAKVIEVEEQRIQGNTNFVEDLEMDSMLALEIVVAVEKKYKIKIPEERLADIKNLNDAVAVAMEFMI
jgi:acyl carrier protein